MNTASRSTSCTHPSHRFSPTLRRGAALALLALVGFAGTTPAQAAIPASERQVLINLYNSANGANWTDNTGWLGAAGTECTWFGVTCDTTEEHVTDIVLSTNNLIGILPPLADLTHLYSFLVDSNELTGMIPSLAGLTNLFWFNANSNYLTGSIPSLAGLTNLGVFAVGVNQLTGSIPPLSGLTNLEIFISDVNQLTGTIPSFAGLTSLSSFTTSSNQLTGTIPSLAHLTNLGEFDVSNNQLRGDVPDVPSPNGLSPGYSGLCPNALNPTPNADWDAATAQTPWYQNCYGFFEDGFEE